MTAGYRSTINHQPSIINHSPSTIPEVPVASRTDAELEVLIRARYPLVYVVSWEEERVEEALKTIARERNKKLNIWTVTQGFSSGTDQQDHSTREPLVALD